MTTLLVVSSLFPTAERPEVGAFVARRVEGLRSRGVDVQVVAARSYARGAIARHMGMALDVLRRRPIDGVESHVLFPAGLIGMLAARRNGVPLIVYAHGADVRESAARTPVHAALARRVARGASFVVANSAATASFVARLGVSARCIPPGVDFRAFSPGAREVARQRVGLPKGGTVALYVGALTRGKGVDVFAEAVSRLPGVLGVLVGAGELGDVVASRWPELRCSGSVPPSEVPLWMQAADIVVVPSREEGLGLAAVEALATGTPVVASAVGGLVEVVTHGSNGLLVPPADVRALSDAIRKLADHPSLRDEFGSAARASVARHDRQIVDAEMGDLWRRLGVEA